MLPCETTWVDLEGAVLSEVGQAEKDKCHMISLICGILKNNNIKLTNKTEQKQTHRYKEHFDVCHTGGDLGGWRKKAKGL